MSNSRLVYSTEFGRTCPGCGKPVAQCRCRKAQAPVKAAPFPADGIIRIRRETQGRKGKTVCAVYGLAGLNEKEMECLVRGLKQRCGAGGSIRDGAIFIQGDHRETLREELIRNGYRVQLVGG